MIQKYIIPLLAAAGLAMGIFMVVRGNTHLPPAQPVAQPPEEPYKTFVAGAGIIEANTENIAIGTPTGGVVTAVFVAVGDRVKAAAPLLKLDDRPLAAELATRKAALDKARAALARLEAQPRAEDVLPLEARLHEAEAALADVKAELALWESVTDPRAVSRDDLDRKRFAARVAQTRVEEAGALLASTRAGAWKPDLQVARADVAAAEAQVHAAETDLERLTVRAPVAGQLLQVKVRVGEFAPAGVLAQPLMVLGGTEPMHVRVDVDENDAWRVRAGMPAVGYARGNRDITTLLKFVRFEPLVVPKVSLTGQSNERVDTRVLQVIYAFDRGDLPLYVGQQMDVTIQAPPATPPVNAGGPEVKP